MLFVLGCGHHIPLVLAHVFLLLPFIDCSWGQGVAAIGIMVFVASVGNCKQCVQFYCNQNKLLP